MSKYLRPWAITSDTTNIPNRLIEDTTINSDAKLCWAVMSRYSNGKNCCWASHETIAKRMGVSARSVARYLESLRDGGFIETARRGDGRTAVHYFLTHPMFKTIVSDQKDEPETEPVDGIPEVENVGNSDMTEVSVLNSELTDMVFRNDNPVMSEAPHLLMNYREESTREELTPPTPSSDLTPEQTMKALRWKFKDAFGTKKLDKATETALLDLIERRGSDALLAIADRVKDHVRDKRKDGESINNPSIYFLGCLRKWDPPELETQPTCAPLPSLNGHSKPTTVVDKPVLLIPMREAVERWNAKIGAGPPVLDPEEPDLVRGLRACLTAPLFVEKLDWLIERVAELHAADPVGKRYLTLEYVCRGDTWRKMLNGKHAFTKPPEAPRFQTNNDKALSALDLAKRKLREAAAK